MRYQPPGRSVLLKEPPRRIWYVLLALLVAVPTFFLVLGISGFLTVRHEQGLLQPIPGGKETTGTVVSFHEYCKDSCTYEPTIKYSDLRGQVHRFTAPYQSEYPAAGSTVKVSYDPRVPGDAHDISLSPSSWTLELGTAIFAIVISGLFLLVVGGVFVAVVVAALRRRARMKMPSVLITSRR